jgi:hypothetical protein
MGIGCGSFLRGVEVLTLDPHVRAKIAHCLNFGANGVAGSKDGERQAVRAGGPSQPLAKIPRRRKSVRTFLRDGNEVASPASFEIADWVGSLVLEQDRRRQLPIQGLRSLERHASEDRIDLFGGSGNAIGRRCPHDVSLPTSRARFL